MVMKASPLSVLRQLKPTPFLRDRQIIPQLLLGTQTGTEVAAGDTPDREHHQY